MLLSVCEGLLGPLVTRGETHDLPHGSENLPGEDDQGDQAALREIAFRDLIDAGDDHTHHDGALPEEGSVIDRAR